MRQRQRETERQKKRGEDRIEREIERMCVCVCVCGEGRQILYKENGGLNPGDHQNYPFSKNKKLKFENLQSFD